MAPPHIERQCAHQCEPSARIIPKRSRKSDIASFFMPAPRGLFYWSEAMADDVSEGWGKWLSFEVLVSIVLAAIAWGVLTSKVSGLEDQVKDQKTVQATEVVESKKVTDDLGREVNQINRKVDVLGTNQEHFKAQINRVDDRLEKIQEILEQQH